MSLISSLYAGQSGLNTTTAELSVIGDNIANASTIGFKSGRAAFQDQLAQSLVGGNGQMGLGAQLEAIQQILTQGSITSSGNATDLALNGNGFFVVKGSNNGVNGSYYTRAGQFTLDKDGYLTNLQGLRVQGFSADPLGNVSGGAGDLRLAGANSPPLATSNITLKANLDAASVPPPAWDPLTPGSTSNFSTSTTVYDSIGAAHDVQVYFRNSGAGWEWHAMADGAGITGGTPGTAQEISGGVLSFDATGRLTNQTQAGTFDPIGATQGQALNFDFGSIASGGTGLAGVTQFASPSATSFVSQNGYAAGDLSSFSVNPVGEIVGAFTNGTTRTIGQVAVANFAAPDKLSRAGGNLYGSTLDAGQPSVGAPGSGGRASVVAGSLEQSNVDLSGQFVEMIAAQRGFQANARTVTTADQLLQELIQLKR